MRNLKALLLVVLMVLSVAVFAACGGNQGEENTGSTAGQLSAEAAYQVVVVDAAGNPVSAGIAVKFMQGGSQKAMQLVNESGVAEKTLTRGDYTVELQFTDPNAQYVYDASDLTLSAEKTQLQIVMSQKLGEESQELSVGNAYYVKEG